MKVLAPTVELLESLKVQQTGTNTSMIGELKDTIVQAIAGEIGPGMMMEMADSPDQPVPDAVPATQP